MSRSFARTRLAFVLITVSSLALPAGATCPIGGYGPPPPPPPPPQWGPGLGPDGRLTETGRVPGNPEPEPGFGGPAGTVTKGATGGTTPSGPAIGPGAPNPGGRAAARGTTPGGRKRAATAPAFDWQTWWWYNQFRFLEFEREEATATVSTDFFLGAADRSSERKAATARTPILLRDRILPAVTEALDAKDAGVRAAAVKALGRIGDGAPVDRIAKLVSDPDRQVRLAATVVLGEAESKAHVPLLVRLASDRALDSTQRGHAVIALGLIGELGSVSALKKVALDAAEIYDVRMCALAALALIPCEETREIMRALAVDKKGEQNFRAFAAGTLGRICADSDTVDLLIGLATDRAPQVRESAIIALGSLGQVAGGARVGETLARALEDDTDFAARAFACIALGESKTPRAKKVLLETFRECPHAALRAFAAIGLGLLGDTSVRTELRDGLAKDSNTASLRGAAAVALGLLRDRESVPLLVRLASDQSGDPAVRGNAALALGLVGDRNALPVVGEVLLSPQPASIISAIAHAVGLLGGPATSEMLVAAMARADNEAQRSHIMHAMGHVRDASFVDPFLKRLQDDSLTDLARADTVLALGHLGDRYSKPWLSALTDHRNFMLSAPTLDAVALLR